jgi:hypothetical protein
VYLNGATVIVLFSDTVIVESQLYPVTVDVAVTTLPT